jgi:predicted ATPase/class 3 adenylate cyclase
MPEPPSGTVTLLFTDIEGSTKLLQRAGDTYSDLLEEHRRLLRRSFEAHGGYEVDTEGDAFFVAFATASDAVAAAAEAQQALAGHEWPDGSEVRVRMGLHTGEPRQVEHRYVGLDVHRAARVMAAGHGGQVLISQATRDLLDERHNVRGLGEHRLKDLSGPQRLYQLQIEGLPQDFPALKTLENRPTNLPIQPTALVGREWELQQLQELIGREDVRLLTLTGPAGSGKTRLAMQVGAEVIDQFPEGVWFVNLAAVAEVAHVLPTVAQTLALKEEPERPLVETLAYHLAEKQLLLLLDNFEQVVDASPDLARLIARSRGLKILVTSRATLRVSGEREYPVPPLADMEALSLFAERAQASKPSFSLNGNRPLVAEICRRLDYLPLAIELAAARIKLLPERALLERLDARLKLLTGGARDLDPRQRTLRGAIDWSYDLLPEREQRLFARLAVFAGGRTLEAIEAVCDPDGNLDTFEGVASLVDKSLLRQEETKQGEPRLVMLETIHEYARERLEESGEADEIRGRHAQFFLALAEELSAGRDVGRPLDSLEREHANFREALTWSLTRDAEVGGRLAAALYPFWDLRGHISEGRSWLRAFLDTDLLTGELRARAYNGLAALTFSAGDYERAAESLTRAISLFEQLGEEERLAHCLSVYALALLEQQQFEEARSSFERALTIDRKLGDVRAVAGHTMNLGLVALQLGELEQATLVFTDALETFERLDDRHGVCVSIENLGVVGLLSGRVEQAQARLAESLRIAVDGGYAQLAVYSLVGLAAVAVRGKDLAKAARLVGAADSICQRTGISLETMERRLLEEVERALTTANDPALGAARGEARGWSGVETVAYALGDEPTSRS